MTNPICALMSLLPQTKQNKQINNKRFTLIELILHFKHFTRVTQKSHLALQPHHLWLSPYMSGCSRLMTGTDRKWPGKGFSAWIEIRSKSSTVMSQDLSSQNLLSPLPFIISQTRPRCKRAKQAVSFQIARCNILSKLFTCKC